MMPFLTQPAVAPTCYVPRSGSAIGQSQVFNGSQSLKRVMAADDPTRWTFVTYFCPADVSGSAMSLFAARGVNDASGRPHETNIEITASLLSVYDFGRVASGTDYQKTSTLVCRDPEAFHQLVVSLDTNIADADDRLKIELDGVRVTSFGTSINPALGFAAGVFNSPVVHALGVCPNVWGDRFFLKGLQASPLFICGKAMPASAFGERNIHGVWVPRPAAEIHAAVAAAGGWGVNGFHLDFSDPLNPGKDVSGKGNHFTASGFDATGKDTVASTPVNVFATLNPLACGYGTGSTITLSDGNLAVAFGGINQSGGRTSIDPSLVNKPVRIDATLISLGVPGNTGLFVCGASYLANGVLSSGATVASYGAGDTITAEYDPVARIVRYYKNGALQGSCAAASKVASVAGGNSSWRLNAGQRPWAYASPSLPGLCTDNLPEPDIKDPGEAFAQAATTGAGMDRALKTLTGHWNGAPYVEIVKRRDASEDWRVRFSDDPGNAWATNNALAKAAAPALVSEGAYVGYRLRVGTRYGIWTAEVEHVTGTVTTVTHGLNTARAAVIATRVSAGGGDRYYRHPDLSAGSLLKLNSNSLAAPDGTLTSFGADSFQIAAGAPSGTYRVLVMAARVGYLCLGAYAATGVAGDGGPFLAMDIAPLLLIQRRHNAVASYEVLDVVREPANPTFKELLLNAPNAENTNSNQFDFVVGGVKCRTDPANSDSADSNASGGQHVFIAIGRPIGGVCVAPATAR